MSNGRQKAWATHRWFSFKGRNKIYDDRASKKRWLAPKVRKRKGEGHRARERSETKGVRAAFIQNKCAKQKRLKKEASWYIGRVALRFFVAHPFACFPPFSPCPVCNTQPLQMVIGSGPIPTVAVALLATCVRLNVDAQDVKLYAVMCWP